MSDPVYGTDLVPDSSPYFSPSHSFTGYSSGTMADTASRVVAEFAHENDEYYYDDVEDEQEGDSESEFEFVVPGAEENSSPISAGEIFSNGQIKPLFPLFNTDLVFGNSDLQIAETSEAIRLPLKKLLLSERETSLTASASCSSSEADDLEGVNSGTYCVWTPPKEEMSKKSKSTGSSKRWKLKNLVSRSHSDGREKFVFLAPKQEEEVPSSSTKAPKMETVGKAHRDHYLRNRAMKESDRKKSYLPYKQDLVGFFTNVNSLSRTMQPF